MTAVDAADARLVGIVLLLAPLVVIVEGALSWRAGYTGAFWAATRDQKLDHIADHRREWVWMGAAWVLVLAAVAGGVTAFSRILARGGQPALADVAVGSFLLGATCWLVGVLLQVGSGDVAARVRRETGATPGWMEPLWSAVGWTEVAYIVLTGLAYVALGVSVVRSGFPSTWIGWVSVAVGGLSVIGILVAPTRWAIPQVPLLVPLLLGVGLLMG